MGSSEKLLSSTREKNILRDPRMWKRIVYRCLLWFLLVFEIGIEMNFDICLS